MRKQTKNTAILYTTILYLCGFFLFLEWLYPLNNISDTNNIYIFVIFALFCFLLSAFQLKWWVVFFMKGLALVLILNFLYFDGITFSQVWFDQLVQEFTFNFKALLTQELYYLTPLFRNFLFLILIWLMSYLLHYWFVQMKRVFLFVLLTFLYITVLDTFTVYNASMAIIRIFIISFSALGIANLLKELDKESIRFSWVKKSPVWLIPLLAVIFLSAMVGLAAPKQDPKWPDPVPFIQSAAENVGNESTAIQKVGYGEDDSQLGGSFIQDNSPVFRATTSDKQYWRIETKDVYTGKGWEASRSPTYESQPDGSISLDTFAANVETTEQEATIEFEERETIKRLVYPYGITKVNNTGEADLFLDTQSDALEARVNERVTNLTSYHIDYESPSYDIKKLRENSEPYPAEIVERYTQVPETLPDRVGELAEEITALHDTRYEKAKAIERYFGRNGFEYQTTDVPVPMGEEDYVDQFLFESKVGYCDNYSTSMIVMLRTLDIPARWVKGFTGGELVDGQETDVYEVTNANAHSWVEVYFPESGWVPFEPTQGFSNMTEFHLGIDEATDEVQDDQLEAPEAMETPEASEMEVPEENNAAQPESDTFSIKWWHVAISSVLLVVIVIVIYKTRFRWQTKALAMKMNSNKDAKTFQDAYHHLMKLLQRQGYQKDPDQTLREYARQIDSHYSTDEMGQLTSYYERLLYNNEMSEWKINELTQLWKNLIKRIMG